jgi:hypothetical protein
MKLEIVQQTVIELIILFYTKLILNKGPKIWIDSNKKDSMLVSIMIPKDIKNISKTLMDSFDKNIATDSFSKSINITEIESAVYSSLIFTGVCSLGEGDFADEIDNLITEIKKLIQEQGD